MLAYSLFSGSKGNSSYVSEGDDAILIDCGRSKQAIIRAAKRAGLDIIPRAVFITHEHHDHISALPMLTKTYAMPVYASPLVCHALEGTVPTELLHPISRDSDVKIGTLTVRAHPLPHDSVANVSYIVTSESGDSVGIATDMGTVPPSLIPELAVCRSVMIESNHDTAMLENGPYPHYLKSRIASSRGHLSNSDCASLALLLASSGVENITLAHLSEENNTPDIAAKTTLSLLESKGITSVRLSVAGDTVRIN